MARRPTSRELARTYLDWQDRERGRTPITVNRYGYTLDQWIKFLGDKHVLDVQLEDLRAFVLRPVQRPTRHSEIGDEPSAATKKRKVAELRSFYRWLQAEGFRYDDPTGRLVAPTVHNESPRPVPLEAWCQLWDSKLSDAERVAFGLGYFGGLRRMEIVNVGPQHLDGGRLANFRRKGGGKKSLPLESCVLLAAERCPRAVGRDGAESFLGPLSRLARERRDKITLLDWGGDGSGVNKRLRVALKRAGLHELSFSPHQLRHSFCTNLLEWGVPLLDVSRLAGHSNVVVTGRYLASSDDPISGMLSV